MLFQLQLNSHQKQASEIFILFSAFIFFSLNTKFKIVNYTEKKYGAGKLLSFVSKII